MITNQQETTLIGYLSKKYIKYKLKRPFTWVA